MAPATAIWFSTLLRLNPVLLIVWYKHISIVHVMALYLNLMRCALLTVPGIFTVIIEQFPGSEEVVNEPQHQANEADAAEDKHFCFW